jgi:hypothetical protein
MKSSVLLIVKLLVSFGLLWFILDKLIDIPFRPSINTFTKSHYFAIGIFCSITYLAVLFRTGLLRANGVKVVMILGNIVLLLYIGVGSIFYYHYSEKIIQTINKDVFIVHTSQPEAIFCENRFSVVRIGTLLSHRLFNIGCAKYNIIHIDEHQVRIVIEKKMIFESGSVAYDTVQVDF